ncbi:MAG: NIPSNAP family protein [Gammaproteobacteria bacterium]|nr:NIPSNAP family protein [Gammaproteobacteria bacterium]
MAVYEMRTYTFYVGKLADAAQLYETQGWPAIEKHHGGRLVGYFMSDIGGLNQLVHLWKFEDDADRRTFWATLFADEDFRKFGQQLRPLIMSQTNQLLAAAPWGPHP